MAAGAKRRGKAAPAPETATAPGHAVLPADLRRSLEAMFYNPANATEHQVFERDLAAAARQDVRLRICYHESEGAFAAYLAGFPPTDPMVFLIGTGRTKAAARRMLNWWLIHPAAKRIADAIAGDAPYSPVLRRVFAASLLRHDGAPVEAKGVTFATRIRRLERLQSAIDALLDETHAPELLPLLQRLAVPDGINTHRWSSGHTKTRRGYRLGLDAIGELPEYLKDLRAEVAAEMEAVERAYRREDDSADPHPSVKQRTRYEAQIRRIASTWRVVFLHGSNDHTASCAAVLAAASAWGIPATSKIVRTVLDKMR